MATTISPGVKPLAQPVYVTRPILPELRALDPYLKEIWESKWLTNHGEKHNRLEAALRSVLGVPGLSVFNNGAIALMVAIKALDLPVGSEVITTPFTFPATPHCISWNGLHPVFCDITPDRMVLDPERVERLITANTSAILGVHVYGFPCEVERLQQIASKHHLRLIYDAAHAFSTTIQNRGIGCFGDISMFSFHPTKLFHTMEGGCLTYADPLLERKIYHLRNFGIKNEEEVVDIGINGKMNELQAAIGLLNLEIFEVEKARRLQLRALYESGLSGIDGLSVPRLPEGTSDSGQYFVIRVNAAQFGMHRDQLHESLKRYNVIARKYFHPLCSEYAPYKDYASSAREYLPTAYQVKEEVLCLPFYGELGNSEVDQICSIIRHLQAGHG